MITFFTGISSYDIALAAATTAIQSAQSSGKTLLFILGPSRAAQSLLGISAASELQSAAPGLDVLSFDGANAISALWSQGRASMPAPFARISSDELPLLPGFDLLLVLQRLTELAPIYDRTIVDAGPADALVRALGLVDGLRWGVRLLFGLDRGPGKSSASVSSAFLPTSFLPPDVVNGAQDLRVAADQARAKLLDPSHTNACYVLPANSANLPEARLAIPALQLQGLVVARVLVGPLLPTDLGDLRLLGRVSHEQQALEHARQIWSNRVIEFPLLENTDQSSLQTLGASILPYLQSAAQPPVRFQHNGLPAVVADLPGLDRAQLKLTLSGDELVIETGPYRHHLLLPEALRGVTNIRATREGDTLIVQRR
jgi:anion-transporting  ArsA/GET3 family ATPase